MKTSDLICIVIMVGLILATSLMATAEAIDGQAQLKQQQLQQLRTQMIDEARNGKPEFQRFVDWFPWAVGVTDSGIICGEAWKRKDD